jgi:next-to-BRCA1 protein 1
MGDGGAEKHNPFHEFFDIREPGRVIVHTVLSGDGERSARSTGSGNGTAQAPPTPVAHNAMCDLCDLAIAGPRYKCCECPDFDTCALCFNITQEQHPGHAFFKIENPTDYIVCSHICIYTLIPLTCLSSVVTLSNKKPILPDATPA